MMTIHAGTCDDTRTRTGMRIRVGSWRLTVRASPRPLAAPHAISVTRPHTLTSDTKMELSVCAVSSVKVGYRPLAEVATPQTSQTRRRMIAAQSTVGVFVPLVSEPWRASRVRRRAASSSSSASAWPLPHATCSAVYLPARCKTSGRNGL
eukprot:969169-Rhodomonas_salina.1